MQSLKPNREQAKAPLNPEYFDGAVMMQTLVPGDGHRDVEVLAVFFENGARTKPHIHPVDQLLVVVEGRCVVATQTERMEIDRGQSAMVPKGEWHWHGAVKGTSACHLSIKKPGLTDWNQPLHDFEEWKPASQQ